MSHETNLPEEVRFARAYQQYQRRGLAAACVLILLGAASFAVDLPLLAFLRRLFAACNWKWLLGSIVRAEVFGHASGVLFVLTAIAVLDPDRRRFLPRTATCVIGVGLVANLIKVVVSRSRPTATSDQVSDVFATFQGWFASLEMGSSAQSFPSAHTACAVAMAICLCSLYPRGRAYFWFLAALTGLSRVVATDHFPSDVLFGAAAACLTVFLFGPLLNPVFQWIEKRDASDETSADADSRLGDAATSSSQRDQAA
ncbi:MAG: phosphatase PAP2 family protein [Planctomycetales bacterium]